MDRLRREMPVRIVAGEQVLRLSNWPASLRRLDGARARTEVRSLAAPTAGSHSSRELVVVLDVDRPGTDGAHAVLLHCQPGAAVAVTARCDPADPWSVSLPAVAEIFAEVLTALLADPLLPPAGPAGSATRPGPSLWALAPAAGSITVRSRPFRGWSRSVPTYTLTGRRSRSEAGR
ncbi:hypothetical protein [Phytohabitans rumicis]|uniref:Uncharacterized protein n=1 Tax=Phytohabitans rumicis TaxID=1076125 RepID=A0A6V8LCZ1_9ACTN|nr:hypothetical protein [Phytohabitans rumicis]GFJ93530.1 hypothetical protein Prum_071720 [Phytohabitans rumicis]